MSTELSQRRIARLLRFHSSLNILLSLHLDVRAHLVIHPRVEPFFLKQRAKSKLTFSKPVHELISFLIRIATPP